MKRIKFSDSLQNSINSLKESLEDKPDTWFHQPKGYLSKPDFKRPEQARANRDKGVQVRNLKNVFKSAFTKRFFVIEGERLIYYKDKSSPVESGSIYLNTIERIEESIIHDAPPNSIDLLTADRCYTLACETSADKQKWVLALASVKELNKPERPRYQVVNVTFPEKELLYMNIRGVGYIEYLEEEEEEIRGEMLIIKSFQKKPNGEPGPAESTGKIKPGDQLIEINEVNLEKMTFNEAVDFIKSSDWPLRMKLRRDRFATSLLPLTKDGWMKVSLSYGEGYYNAEQNTSSKRSKVIPEVDYTSGESHRRYLELRESQLACFKPTIGGSAMQKPEFLIDLVNATHYNLEKGQYESEEIEYQLQIAVNDIETSTDSSVPAITRYVVLTFSNENDLMAWASVIKKASEKCKRRFTTPLNMPETVTERELNSVSESGAINLKSTLMVFIKDGPTSISSGTFIPRFVDWFHNSIKVQRVKEKQWLGQTKYVIRNGSECLINSFQYISVPSQEKTRFRLIIRFQDKTELILASDKQETLKPWKLTCEILEEIENVKVLRDSRKQFDEEGYEIYEERNEIVEYERKHEIGNHDLLFSDSNHGDSCGYQYEDIISDNPIFSSIGIKRGATVCKSYMLKKGEKKSNSLIGSETLRRRYFVLSGALLFYYKDTIDCDPLGVIDLRYSRDIRLSTNDTNLKRTEFAFEILSDNRVYSLATENEESLNYWMDAIAMAIDAFGGHVEEDTGREAPLINLEDIIKEGFLKQYITKDTLISGVTKLWKTRYIQITNEKIVLYENEADAFDPQIDPVLVLDSSLILKVNTIVLDEDTKSTKYDKVDFDHFNAFEVDAGIDYTTGEDRNFAFCARDINEAKSWMESLCLANGDKLSIVEGFKVVKLKDREQETQQEIVIYKSVEKEKVTTPTIDTKAIPKREEVTNGKGGRGLGRGAGIGGRGGRFGGRGRGTAPVKPA